MPIIRPRFSNISNADDIGLCRGILVESLGATVGVWSELNFCILCFTDITGSSSAPYLDQHKHYRNNKCMNINKTLQTLNEERY